MDIKKEVFFRNVAGENMLIPVGMTVDEFNGIFTLTPTAAFLWNLLPQIENEEEAVQRVLDEYDVDEETARRDISDFFNKLREIGLI